jgi:hypothetical protein
MGIISWPPPTQTDLIAKVATDGLPGLYDATVRLGRAELFHDGWQPMLDAVAMRMLLADLGGLGDEHAQLASLGWTLRASGDGQIELVEANLPAETLDQVDGRWRLPRECGFTVVDELPPLAQLYRGLTLLEAYAYGPTDQFVGPDDLLAQARTGARRHPRRADRPRRRHRRRHRTRRAHQPAKPSQRRGAGDDHAAAGYRRRGALGRRRHVDPRHPPRPDGRRRRHGDGLPTHPARAPAHPLSRKGGTPVTDELTHDGAATGGADAIYGLWLDTGQHTRLLACTRHLWAFVGSAAPHTNCDERTSAIVRPGGRSGATVEQPRAWSVQLRTGPARRRRRRRDPATPERAEWPATRRAATARPVQGPASMPRGEREGKNHP